MSGELHILLNMPNKMFCFVNNTLEGCGEEVEESKLQNVSKMMQPQNTNVNKTNLQELSVEDLINQLDSL